MKKKIIIIGSGFGGLGAAVRLAALGHDVELFEKRDKLGGRAYTYDIDGFTFDGGPTIITAPFMFDDLFAKAGKRREEYVDFVRCDPFYRIFDHEGRYFDYDGDEMGMLERINAINPEDKRGYLNFLEGSKQIFDKGFLELGDKPFLHKRDMLRVTPDLMRLQSYRSVYNYVSGFIQDEFLRKVFSFHPLLVGGNPFDTTSIYSLINYLEREWGVWYAMGGTGALVDALGKLFEELGGTVHLNTEVKRLIVDERAGKNRIRGVELANGDKLYANDIVCNADVAFTYQTMVDPKYRKKYTDKKLANMKYSMSLFVSYFGTKRQYRDGKLKHHNILLGERYKGLLDDIFETKTLADDFSLYLHMPTLTDPSLAPEGHEAFYVLSPVPNLGATTDWKETAKPYRDRIMQFLEDNYLPGLQENLVVEHHIDPLHFRDELNSYKGSAFSFEPTLRQSAWFRPHNRSEEFANLYFVGAGTHPGAGLPGVLSSAKIAEDLITAT